MPDWITTALATPGLGWLVLSIVAAGLVRGFSGFGSALIIMPVASSVLSPFAAILFLTVVEMFGPLPNLRNALQNGALREVGMLLFGAAVGLPVGLALLSLVSPEAFNWAVSIAVLLLLITLMFGWRYEGELRPSGVTGVGVLGGFMAGIIGIPGPPVIIFYMASRNAITMPAAMIRAMPKSVHGSGTLPNNTQAQNDANTRNENSNIEMKEVSAIW
jgi:uncharacterized membrane protein YfcA